MITTAIINLGYSIINGIIGFFPTGPGFNVEVHDAVTSLGGYLQILDPLIPIATLLTVVSLVFTVEIALFGFRTLKWVISHIPFVGGK